MEQISTAGSLEFFTSDLPGPLLRSKKNQFIMKITTSDKSCSRAISTKSDNIDRSHLYFFRLSDGLCRSGSYLFDKGQWFLNKIFTLSLCTWQCRNGKQVRSAGRKIYKLKRTTRHRCSELSYISPKTSSTSYSKPLREKRRQYLNNTPDAY